MKVSHFLKALILIIGIVSSNASFADSGNLSPANKPVKTVVIDAGHGGKDPGANIGKILEKDIALKIALKLGGYIEKYLKNIKVIYTRKTDKFIELHERSAIANRNNADLFISIHVNASTHKHVRGTSVYVMGLNKADENLDVAKRENSVILKENNFKKNYKGFDPNSPEYEIIFSLYQNAYLNQSILLADKITKQFAHRASRKDRGVRQAGLVVLWNCTMPGILVETGFITNSSERKYLNSDYGQSIIASAMFRAVRAYFGKSYRKSEAEIKQSEKLKPKVSENNSSNVIFKVQIASSPKKLSTEPKNFKGLQNVERKHINGRYKYYAGKSSSYTEIQKLQTVARKKYSDAFVIALKNNKRISMKEALGN